MTGNGRIPNLDSALEWLAREGAEAIYFGNTRTFLWAQEDVYSAWKAVGGK